MDTGFLLVVIFYCRHQATGVAAALAAFTAFSLADIPGASTILLLAKKVATTSGKSFLMAGISLATPFFRRSSASVNRVERFLPWVYQICQPCLKYLHLSYESSNKNARILRRNKSHHGDLLPTDVLVKVTQEAFKEAASKTMEVMGYNVIADNGWVVKLYPDGHKEKISKLPFVNRTRPIILD